MKRPQRIAITYRLDRRVQPYEDALRMVGLEPARIHVEDMGICRDEFEGLLLSGGPDIDPCQYGCLPCAHTENSDRERDIGEIAISNRALKRGIPILGICRGMQLLNIAVGGTLIQHLSSEICHLAKTTDLDFPGKHHPAHSVNVFRETRLFSITKADSIQVNSRHHQAIQKLGFGFMVSAAASDGIIEAIERRGGPFVLGVQWHPEDRIFATDHDKAIFISFAEAIYTASPFC